MELKWPLLSEFESTRKSARDAGYVNRFLSSENIFSFFFQPLVAKNVSTRNLRFLNMAATNDL